MFTCAVTLCCLLFRLRSYPTTEPGATIVPKFLAALVKGRWRDGKLVFCVIF
jgi:hypothetical protein